MSLFLHPYSLPAAWPFKLALLVYAALGLPTPPGVGWVEIVIALLLAVSVAQPFAGRLVRFQPALPMLVMAYGFSVPLLMGVVQGAEPSAIVRDMIPFLFLFLPLLAPRFPVRDLEQLVVIMALILSVRALWIYYVTPDIARLDADYRYLANSPLLLLAGLLCLRDLFAPQLSWRKVVAPLAMAVFFMAVFLVHELRAPAFILAASAAVFAAMTFPARPVMVLAVAGVACFLLLMFGMPGFEALAEKMQRVGSNHRIEEIRAVIDTFDGDIIAALFGHGWGAMFLSPAVGYVSVGYTHNFFSYVLLKTGMAGLACVLGYLAVALVRLMRQHARQAFIIAAACLVPLFFYTTYKTLDFGIVLLLAHRWIRGAP